MEIGSWGHEDVRGLQQDVGKLATESEPGQITPIHRRRD
jgi:hypothetical protein